MKRGKTGGEEGLPDMGAPREMVHWLTTTGRISRREFVNGILVSAASLALMPRRGESASHGHLLAPLDKTDSFTICHEIWRGKNFIPTESAGILYDCIIVGGGMSGLVAAWKLQRLGVAKILVVDQNEMMGGLCRADEIGGVTFARASAYASFPSSGELTELYRDIGLIKSNDKSANIEIDRKYLLQPPHDQIHMQGQWAREPFNSRGFDHLPVTKKIRDEMKAFAVALDELRDWKDKDGRSAFDCPPDDATRSPKIRSLDAITLGDFAVSRGWSRKMTSLFDPLLRSAYGLGHDRVSAWAALDFLGDEILPEEPGKGSLSFPGGNAFLAEGLARRIGGETLLNKAFVTQVSQQGREVRVGILRDGKSSTVKARAVIFAAPPFMAPYLLPGFPEKRRKAVKSLEYAPYLVANVAVSKTPAKLSYSNLLLDSVSISDFIVADWAGLASPLAAPLDRPNVLSCYCPMPAKNRMQLMSLSFDNWTANILADLERCLPGVGRTVTGVYLYRWGHAFAVPLKGGLFSDSRRLMKQPFGRIFFAGADIEGIPTVEHAIAGGFRAAEEVSGLLDV